jgi:hypothetical protein
MTPSGIFPHVLRGGNLIRQSNIRALATVATTLLVAAVLTARPGHFWLAVFQSALFAALAVLALHDHI